MKKLFIVISILLILSVVPSLAFDIQKLQEDGDMKFIIYSMGMRARVSFTEEYYKTLSEDQISEFCKLLRDEYEVNYTRIYKMDTNEVYYECNNKEGTIKIF